MGQRTKRPRRVANEGSIARDHLANERTYLAWLRTGLGSAALGAAVIKLLTAEGVRATVGGAAFILLGMAFIVLGTVRYNRVRRALEDGMVQIAWISPIVIGVVAVLATVAVLIISL